jgi:hypothetical protein
MAHTLEDWLDAASCGYEALLATAQAERKTVIATADSFDAQREAVLAMMACRDFERAAARAVLPTPGRAVGRNDK